LGYGLEYTYSVIERLKLAALSGDTMQQPMIVTAGYEAWRAKETRTNEGVPAEWGDWEDAQPPVGDDDRHAFGGRGQHRRGCVIRRHPTHQAGDRRS
jgi:hypothetical protein